MVIFTPLWEIRNMSVSTNTLSDLCDILDCELEDVALYVRDENDKFIKKRIISNRLQ